MNCIIILFFFDASLDGYQYGLNTKRVIEDFNGAGLLEIHGEKYKKAYYPKEDIVLREYLERRRIFCTHEESLSDVFYKREILNNIFSAFDSAREIYFMLREALL